MVPLPLPLDVTELLQELAAVPFTVAVCPWYEHVIVQLEALPPTEHVAPLADSLPHRQSVCPFASALQHAGALPPDEQPATMATPRASAAKHESHPRMVDQFTTRMTPLNQFAIVILRTCARRSATTTGLGK